MKDWILELCPEIAEWQAELIAEHVERAVAAEREACAKVCERAINKTPYEESVGPARLAAAIRARKYYG